MKKLIETGLPLEKLNQLSVTEKVGKGHPWNLHLWWNRSPIAASTELLKAVITDADGKVPQELPTLCDPFAGSGSMVLAAEKLGLNVLAGDLNGVAALVTKAEGKIPSRFAGQKAVNPQATSLVYKGTEGLIEDIRYYGTRLKEKVQKQLSAYYPERVYAWVWVRTMPCPNPACGAEMPLGNSFILSQLKGRAYWTEPAYDQKQLYFKIHQGICPEGKETNKHGSRGSRFQCPVCGTLTKDAEVKNAGRQGKIHACLMAVVQETENGRIYLEPDASQLAIARGALSHEMPGGAISSNTRWFSTPEYGFKDYAELYTGRQAELLTSFCEALPTIRAEVKQDALQAGWSDDNQPLSQNGRGALAYSEAISVYLALVISKLANFQSTLCTWDHRKGNIRAAFNRQALPMTWTFAEGNPFGHATGNYDSMLKQVSEALSQVPLGVSATVNICDARKFPYPQDAILFTELPYYDNVGYGDLSDYFYIWLRHCLQGIYPELFASILSLKHELSSVSLPYSGDTGEAKAQYEKDVAQLFTDFYPAASTAFPSVVFFRYSAEDENAIYGQMEKNTSSPLENLLQGILKAGFAVTAIWPARTEKVRKNDSQRIAVVFRKDMERLSKITRRSFIQNLKRELPGLLEIAFQNVDREDWRIAGLGFGLQILGHFTQVMNADGSTMVIHDALQLIAQEVDIFREEKGVETPSMKEG